MDVLETLCFLFPTNIDDRDLQHSNTNVPILTQPSILKATPRKRKSKR